MAQPGAFQCMLLKAFELSRPYRDVVLLKEFQGHSLQEISFILGISIDRVSVRLKRAHRAIGSLGDSDPLGFKE
jgi:DNA-directed RNA polymerase specialized sigma24 family protein